MKKYGIIVLLLLCSLQNYAQLRTDSVEIRKNFFGTTFRQKGKVLTQRQLKNIVLLNNEAFNEIKKADVSNGISMVLGCAGGALIGWPLGASAAGKKMDWTLFGAGVGLIVVAIPFSSIALNHTKKAVNIYNSGLKQKATSQLDLRLDLNQDGIGFIVKF